MITLKYKNIYLKDWYTIAGKDEQNGNIKNIDYIIDDMYFGEKTMEDAEIKMQRTVLNNLINNNKFNLVIGGDLSNQLGIMNQTMKNNNLSFLGLYNACSTFVESIIVGANILNNKTIKNVCLLTSSHCLTSERQFRFPIEYGALRFPYQTITITASIGAILTSEETNYKVVSSTIGSVVDYDVKDVANMGAVMAPAAYKVIIEHLKNNNKKVTDYDLILTGDLGSLGLNILKELFKVEKKINVTNIQDAGSMIYKKNQNMLMGGSGPTCLPFVLFNKILKEKYKKILIVGTGALHNPTLVNQKKAIPSIAHAVEIEVNNVN